LKHEGTTEAFEPRVGTGDKNATSLPSIARPSSLSADNTTTSTLTTAVAAGALADDRWRALATARTLASAEDGTEPRDGGQSAVGLVRDAAALAYAVSEPEWGTDQTFSTHPSTFALFAMFAGALALASMIIGLAARLRQGLFKLSNPSII